MSFLTATAITKSIHGYPALKNIHFVQQKGQRLAIAGETGSGKSTLLKIIAGWIPPDEGEVWFEGERVKKVPAEKLIPGHPGIAYLSQQFELPNFLTVSQVLEYANNLNTTDAGLLYDICQITHLLHRRTDELSGGEKQRIAIARLLTGAPRLLLLDEPYSNLDMGHKNILKAVIRDLSVRLSISCILVSHDPLDTLSWADSIMVLRAGEIVQQGAPEVIYRQPLDIYTAALFGKFNLIPSSMASALSGQPPVKITDSEMWLLRPEDIQVGPSSQGSPSATVIHCSFFGSYYEVELDLNGHRLTGHSTAGNFPEKEVVSVRVQPGSAWHLPP
jgi:ABC-type Fe3+/spermidine/putrescine transport system ATPase subunit